MVPSIARQSVIIKCNMQKSILTGNYEFYYAAGLIANLSGVEIPEDIKPEELLALLSEKIPTLTPADEKEKYLFGMAADYRPEDVYDEQMRELLDWGRTEKYLWTVALPGDLAERIKVEQHSITEEKWREERSEE